MYRTRSLGSSPECEPWYLLVADGAAHAGAGAGHPRLGGHPLALQLGRVGGDHSMGHQHGGQVGVGS